MAEDKISEIVDPKAYKQLDDLTTKLQASQKALVDNIDAAIKLNVTLANSKTLPAMEKNATQAAIAMERLKQSQLKTEGAQLRLDAATKRATDAAAKQTLRTQEQSRAYTQLSNQLEINRKKAQDIGAVYGRTSKQFQAAAKEVNALDKRVKDLDAGLGKHQRNVGNYKSALGGIPGRLLAWGAALVGVQQSLSFTFNKALNLDSIRTSLAFTLGSFELADAKMNELRKTANRLGLSYEGLADAYKSFTGAAVASNFPLEKSDAIFQAVANASSKMRLSTEQTEGAMRALQQMISKGSVQSEELRGQLGERLPGAFAIAARAMKLTEKELSKQLELGNVLAIDLLPKLTDELNKTFGASTTEKVEGLRGAWERLKNSFVVAVGENTRITGFFESIINGINTISETLFKTVNSTGWNEFFARLTSNKTADVIRELNQNFAAGNKAAGVALNGKGDPKKTYELVKIAYDNATKSLKEYQKAVNEGTLEDKGDVTIEKYTKLVQTLGSHLLNLKRFIPPEVASITKKELSAAELEKIRKKEEEELKKRAELRKKFADQMVKDANDILKVRLILADGEIKLEEQLAGRVGAINDRVLKEQRASIDAFGKMLEEAEKKKKELAEKAEKDEEERLDRKYERILTHEQEVFDVATAFLSARFQKESDSINEIEKLQQETFEAEVARINASLLSDQDKANKLSILEAQRAAQKQQNDRAEREIAVRKAKFDRDTALFQIAIQTAINVIKLLLTPPLALAAAAAGAAQAAVVLATPLPKFKEGGKMHQSGLAEFGHGTELRIDPDGKVSLTGSKPEVGYVKKDTQFISNRDLVRMIAKPDPIVYAGGQAIDLKELVDTTKDGTKRLEGAINGLKQRDRGINYYSTAKGRSYLNRNLN